MLSAYQNPVITNPTTDFIEALTTGQASAVYSFKLPSRVPYWFLRAIMIEATENLDYELWLFRSATNLVGSAAVGADGPIGIWQFQALTSTVPAAPGYPVTPVGGTLSPYYRYYIDGNLMPLVDMDWIQSAQPAVSGGANPGGALPQIHARLVNRSTASKTAGTGGALQVTFYTAAQGRQV